VRNILWKELQNYQAAEPPVFGFVDYTHAATTEFLDDAVVRDGLADERIGNCHVRSY